MKFLRFKKIAITVIILVTLLLITGMIAHFWVKKTVLHFLTQEIPSGMTIDYKNLYVNVPKGIISLKDIEITLKEKSNNTEQTVILLDEGSINVSPLQLFDKKNITIEVLKLEHPRIVHYMNNESSSDSSNSFLINLKNKVEINKLSIINGELKVYSPEKNELNLSLKKLNLTANNVSTDSLLIKRKIPVNFNDYELSLADFFAVLNTYEQFTLAQFSATANQWTFENLRLTPIYTKLELSKHLYKERDHLTLEIPKLQWRQPTFSEKNDRLLVAIDSIQLFGPKLNAFRDKLVADDPKTKPLYPELLRKLPFDLMVRKTMIEDGFIDYMERIDETSKMEGISFESLNATVLNLGRIENEETTVEVATSSMVMGKIPMVLNWDFDPLDHSDHFNAAGSFENLKMSDINAYLLANLRAEATGDIKQMYFTISGNQLKSSGEIKMQYENLHFKILKKNNQSVNKFLTTIGDLFVKNNSNTKDDEFRYGAIDTERDETKSFFNYIWLNVRDGMISTLTGNGKPKD